ncbi:MAG: response regulator transcription factor [Desulfomonilia bacterium]|nr:response regulator transcription factor [Desulfomonilia bacterium]
MIRVLVADDHPIVREGLKQILADIDDITVVSEAANGQQALNAVWKEPFDVILLDISMPGRDGLEILQELKKHFAKIPVLVLSMYPEEQYAIRVLKSGAAGYLSKSSAPEELISAIRKVASGGKYISPAVAEQLSFELDRDPDRPGHERLSDREYQVLRMIAAGKTITEIAQELFLSVKTVSTYRLRILQKLNLKNTAAIVLYAVEHNLKH